MYLTDKVSKMTLTFQPMAQNQKSSSSLNEYHTCEGCKWFALTCFADQMSKMASVGWYYQRINKDKNTSPYHIKFIYTWYITYMIQIPLLMKNKMCLWITNVPGAAKSKLAIFSIEVMVEVVEADVIWKGFFSWVCMPNIKFFLYLTG